MNRPETDPEHRDSASGLHKGEGEFSVFQFFPDDSYEQVLQFVDGKTAVECAKRLSESVGGRLGTTRRIIITDGGDSCVFEWRHGEGVTFPPRNERAVHG